MATITSDELDKILSQQEGVIELRVNGILLVAGQPDGDGGIRQNGDQLRPTDRLLDGDRVACRGAGVYLDIIVEFANVRVTELDQGILDAVDLIWIDANQTPISGEPLSGQSLVQSPAAGVIDAESRVESDLGATSQVRGKVEELLDNLGDSQSASPDGEDLVLELHSLFELALDQMEEEAQLKIDAMDLAVDQVQDMRLHWIETPKRESFANILAASVLIVALEIGVAAAVGAIIIRAIRARRILKTNRALNQKATELENFHKAIGDLTPARIIEKNKQKFDALTLREDAKEELRLAYQQLRVAQFADQNDINVVLRKMRGVNSDAPTREAAQKAVDKAREKITNIDASIKEIEKSLEILKSRTGRFEPTQVIDEKEVLKIIRSGGKIDPTSSVPQLTGKVTKEVTESVSAISDPVGAKDTKTDNGDSPSSIVRQQMLRFVREEYREIQGIRRHVDALRNLALSDDRAIAVVLDAYSRLLKEIVWPSAGSADYEIALRETALDFELSLWALILKDLRFRDKTIFDYMKLPDEEKVEFDSFRLSVDGLKLQMLKYFSRRFSTKLKLKPLRFGEDESESARLTFVEGLVQALRTRFQALDSESNKIFAARRTQGGEFRELIVNEPLEESFPVIQHEEPADQIADGP